MALAREQYSAWYRMRDCCTAEEAGEGPELPLGAARRAEASAGGRRASQRVSLCATPR